MKQQSKKCLDTLTTKARVFGTPCTRRTGILAPWATGCDWPTRAYPGIHSTDLWSRSGHTYKPQGPGRPGVGGQEGRREGREGVVWWAQTELTPRELSFFLDSGRAAGEPYTLHTFRYLGTPYLPPPRACEPTSGASSGHLGLCAPSRYPVPASRCSSHHAPAASCMARPCPIPTLPCLQVQVSSTQHPSTRFSHHHHHPSSLLSLPIFQPPRSSSTHSAPPIRSLSYTASEHSNRILPGGLPFVYLSINWAALDWTGDDALDNPQLEINPGLESQNRYTLLHLTGGLRRISHSIHRIYPLCFPASRAPPPN